MPQSDHFKSGKLEVQLPGMFIACDKSKQDQQANDQTQKPDDSLELTEAWLILNRLIK